MALVTGLWSLLLEVKGKKTVQPKQDTRVTQVALGDINHTGRSLVKIHHLQDDEDDEDEDEDEEDDLKSTVLCSMTPGQIEQVLVDVVLLEGEEYIFENTGDNTVYLTGNYIDQSVLVGRGGSSDPDAQFYMDDSDDTGVNLYSDDDSRFEEIAEGMEDEAPKHGKRGHAEHDVYSEDEASNALPPKVEKTRPEKKLKGQVGDAVAGSAASQPAKTKAEHKKGKDKAGPGKDGHKGPSNKKDATDAKVAAGQEKKPALGQEKKSVPDQEKDIARQEKKSTPGQEKKDVAGQEKKGATTLQKKDKKKSSSKDSGATREVADGLTIRDAKVGTGPQAKKGDKVSMRYIGKLQDGKVFDQNTKGKPLTFHLGGGEVIKGWDLGIVGMQVGGERVLTVSPQMGYGKKGAGPIPSNSTLSFECKLLEIK